MDRLINIFDIWNRRLAREETMDVTNTDVDTPSLSVASTATAVSPRLDRKVQRQAELLNLLIYRIRPLSVSPFVTW